jgi:hypothetical protein
MVKGVIENLSKLFGASSKELVPNVGVKYANSLAKSLVDRGFEPHPVGAKGEQGYIFKMSNHHGMDITVAFGKSREFKESDAPGVYISNRYSHTPLSVGIKNGKDSLYKNFEFANPVNMAKKDDSQRVIIDCNNQYSKDQMVQEKLLDKVYDILGMCERGDLYGLKKEFEGGKPKEKKSPSHEDLCVGLYPYSM